MNKPLDRFYPTISKQKAVDALQSVGRQSARAFQKFMRPESSSPLMDKLENQWWDKYGMLIERVWSLPDDLCSALRGEYLQEAKRFFLGNSEQAITILEIGCGSGWVGRAIASENLRIIGTDISQTQIEIASASAQAANKNEYCKYYCTASLEEIPGIANVQGVILHAFLHHLYWEELENFFQALQALLPNGAKIFIVEPIYFSDESTLNFEENVDWNSLSHRKVNEIKEVMHQTKKQLIDLGKFDTEMESSLKAIISESDENGYFFSPKEVPFHSKEFRKFLKRYTKLHREYITGLFDIDVAQLLSYVTDERLRNLAAQKLLPIAKEVDQFLIRSNCIKYFAGERYLFVCYECELSSKYLDMDATQFRTAIDFLNSGKSVESLDLFLQVKEELSSTSLVTVEYGKAIALTRLGRIEEAIVLLEELIARAPNHEKAQLLLHQLKATQPALKQSTSSVLFQADAGFYSPVQLNPSTLANMATSPEIWNELLSFHHLLASDKYVAYLDAYYREGFRKFGKHWWYLDIVNILFAASKALQPKNYLEIGVRRGRSLCTVVRGCPSVNIFGFDMWVDNYAGMENPGPDFVRSELEKHGHTGALMLVSGDSHQTIPRFFAERTDLKLDIITVDGDHSENGAFADLCNVVPRLSVGGVVVFDDIAHPEHPYLLDVWRRIIHQFPFLSGFEFTESGYGVAFAIRMRA